MEAVPAWNRALQLRAIDALRSRLPRPTPSGLPTLESLAQTDLIALCEIGAGRVGVVAVVLPGPAGAPAPSDLAALVDLVRPCVRRTDLLLMLDERTLVVFAPGLDPLGGQALIERLAQVLGDALGETPAAVPALGAAYRSPLSMSGWDPVRLAEEARRRATSRLPEADDPTPVAATG